jgi:hypothetical protein
MSKRNGTITSLADLTPDPQNRRKRTSRNLGMIVDSLHEVGAARSIVIDEHGTVLAGNGVLEAAAEAGIERVQVVEADGETIVAVRRSGLTEAQKRKLALFDNRAAELSEWDLAQLAEDAAAGLDFDGLFRDDELKELLAVAAAQGEAEDDDEPLSLSADDVPDALFPTDNEWQVPLLDLARQADHVDLPAVAWGSIARTKRMRGTWHFYTEDYRYSALWDDPTPIPNSGCISAVEPNFSCYEQTPRAIALYRIYHKRWIARWWQSQGIRVFVDLNVASEHYDLNLLGVPAGWRAYATRGYAERLEDTVREWEMGCERAGSEDVLFFVYGGGKAVAAECGKRGWVHVDEHMNRVKREAKEAESG